MLKVREHSTVYKTLNRSNGKWSDMINVIYIEEGRGTANANLEASNTYLSSQAGEQIGLEGTRTHTEPVLADKAHLFPIHKDFGGTSDKTWPGYINRVLTTFPTIPAQADFPPQNVGGEPTYFSTVIGSTPEGDVDKRLPLSILCTMPEGQSLIKRMVLRKTEVVNKPAVSAGYVAQMEEESVEGGANIPETRPKRNR